MVITLKAYARAIVRGGGELSWKLPSNFCGMIGWCIIEQMGAVCKFAELPSERIEGSCQLIVA